MGIRQAAFRAHPAEPGRVRPGKRNDAHGEKIQRPKQQRLQRVAVFVCGKRGAPFRGWRMRRIRRENEQAEGYAATVRPFRPDAATVERMRRFDVAQKQHKAQEGLRQAPGALQQDIN